jgi:hypothetical protein
MYNYKNFIFLKTLSLSTMILLVTIWPLTKARQVTKQDDYQGAPYPGLDYQGAP